MLRIILKTNPNDISDQHVEDLFLELSHGNTVSALSLPTVVDFLDQGSTEQLRQSMLLLREYDLSASSSSHAHGLSRVRATHSRAVKERMLKYFEDPDLHQSTDQPQYSTMCGLAVMASKIKFFDDAISQLEFENNMIEREIRMENRNVFIQVNGNE
uniref:Uncharacterized protein n=1 Tax=Octactis speculum TaxID=3111310 RepID=A0A7S2D2C2_9STRA|mmetsp:Transcript_41899/g.57137  ORF Transcript_41899/g.57137 Transcript_41899/m.57137 type:complete len:157 (+) Transcript_41899:78-548(+)